MLSLAFTLLLVAAPDKELQTKLDAVKKQLSSLKTTDRLAGLDAAAALGPDASPLIPKVSEMLLDKANKNAEKAADALKAINPKVHDAVLKMKAAKADIGTSSLFAQHLGIIEKLDEDGRHLIWVVHLHLNQAQRGALGQAMSARAFKLLRDLEDDSDAHLNLAVKHKIGAKDLQDGAKESLLWFANGAPEKRGVVLKAMSAEWLTSADGIAVVASYGKLAKPYLPELKKLASLSPNVAVRDAAADAVKSIEAAKD